jgi:hypothetical protein
MNHINGKSFVKKALCYSALTMFGVVFIFCSLFMIDFFTLDGASLEAGKKRGEPIIRALEQYHQDQGTYPVELVSLVPNYVKSIPQPAWRYQFNYDTCSSYNNYVLWFRRSNDVDTYCGYVSSGMEWKCSDSIPPRCETKE